MRAPARPRVPLVPVEPIRPFLQLAVKRLAHRGDTCGGQKELARRYAARFDADPASCARLIERLFSERTHKITLPVADRLTTFLGLHFDNVWPGLVRLEDVAF